MSSNSGMSGSNGPCLGEVGKRIKLFFHHDKEIEGKENEKEDS